MISPSDAGRFLGPSKPSIQLFPDIIDYLMTTPPSELDIPESVYSDPNAVEMLRAWIAERQLHCSLNVGEWHRDGRHDERMAWGLLLADIGGNIAREIERTTGQQAAESLRAIAASFNAEVKRSLAESADPSASDRANTPRS